MTGPGRHFDRYELLNHLGAGGMGEVFEARAVGPHGFEKRVALKRVRPRWAEDEPMVDRFIAEARIAAQLQHPNVVQTFDFGRFGDELFIVMELVDGVSLAQLYDSLRTEDRWLSVAQALTIAAELARALECAHGAVDDSEGSAGVIHRDVSPANILVSRGGAVKLTDFGIASWSTAERISLVAGKPPYMAPEQLLGGTLTAQTDLFALGVVLYEALVGGRPWPDDAPQRAIKYELPLKRAAQVPQEVDELVAWLLEEEPEKRPPSARAFLDSTH